MNSLHQFFFGYFPYICLAVFLVGSLLRFDRDQYTWKTDSSQLLRTGQLRWGSNLFHIGILVIFFGHTVGLLTPPWIYEIFISTADKKLMAISVGGVAGVLGLIGLSLLLHRRLSDPRIRATSKSADILILWLLWAQFALGLATIWVSVQYHLDGAKMAQLSAWAQHIVTFRAGAAELLVDIGWITKAHLVLGMTLFLVFPFSRLVHVWSGFGTLAYLRRPYQLVRSRRLGLGERSDAPR